MKVVRRKVEYLCLALLLLIMVLSSIVCSSNKVAHADTYPIDKMTDYCIPDSLSTYLASQKLTDANGVVHNKYVLVSDNAIDMHNNVWYVYETFVLDEDDNILSIGNFIYPKQVQLQGRLEIPGSVIDGATSYKVSGVGYEAFKDTNAVGTLVIQGGVERIDMRAFHNAGVSNMDLPDTIFDLGNGCFGYNYNLAYVKLPNQLKKTGYQAFQYCISLSEVRVPDGLEEFSAESFNYCESLASIDIKSSVKTLGYKCFGHTGLTSINLNNITKLEAQVFEHCTDLASINWGSCSFGDRIDYRTFYMCESLGSIVLPDNIKQIGTDCFNGCTGVTSIDLANIEMLEYCAFANTGISELEIPASVNQVGSFCFGNTSNLKKVTFHNDIRQFNASNYQSGQLFVIFGKLTYSSGNDQWNNDGGQWHNNVIEEVVVDNASITDCVNTPNGFCEYLTGLKKVTLSDNIKTINYQSFAFCDNLETVVMASDVNAFQDQAFYKCYALYQMNPTGEVDFNLPTGLYWMGDSVFFECSSLGSVTIGIGNPVQHIGRDCFMYAGITDLQVGNTVTEIGMNAFKELTNLETVYANFPASITGDGLYYTTFWNAVNLKEFTIGKDVQTLDPSTCNFLYANTIKFEEGSPITVIPYHSFFGCFYLNEIVLPEGLIEIKDEAFQQCYELDSISLPNTTKIVERNAFFDCHSLATVEGWEYLTKIGDYAFFNNLSLEKVVIGENVEYLGVGSFYNTFALDELVLDNAFISGGRTIIQSGMNNTLSLSMRICRLFGRDERQQYHATNFNHSKPDCTPEHNYFKLVITDKVEGLQLGEFEGMYLKEVVFEDNGKVKEIPNFAFVGNQYLEKVDLGNSVETIGMASFGDCTKLEGVELPLSVSKLNEGAFTGCTSLAEIYMYNPDIVIEEYTNGNLTHIDSTTGDTLKKYKQNQYDLYGYCHMTLNLWMPVDRGDTEFYKYSNRDGVSVTPIPSSWIIDKDVAESATFDIRIENSSRETAYEDTSVKYCLFGELQPVSYIKYSCSFLLFEDRVCSMDFNNTDYNFTVVNETADGLNCTLDVLVTPKNDTVPEYTDIYAYRYTKPNWTTEGYVPDDDISLYSETSPMEYIDTYTRSGALYPLDEVTNIEGTVAYPNQLKGVSYDKFGITVSGTRRDTKKLDILGYTNDYDETDLTLGNRDVDLEYECPVSLVNGKPTDTVVVSLNDERKVVVQGALKYSNGKPIAGKTIRLVKDDLSTYSVQRMFNLIRSGTPILYETTTDDKGEFKFNEVAVGEYNLQLFNDVEKNEVLASVTLYVQNIYDNNDTTQDNIGVDNEADNIDTTVSIDADLFNVDAIMSIEDPDDTEEPTTEEPTTEEPTTEEPTTEDKTTEEEPTTEDKTTEEEPTTEDETTEEETTEGTTEEQTTEEEEDEPTTEDGGEPDTGDKDNPVMVIWLLLSCILCAVGLCVFSRLEKKE